MPADLKITGAAELERALKQLGTDIAGRLGQNAVRAGAREFVNEAKQRVPVRTGALRASIREFTLAERRQYERTAWVGSRLFYARFVELGTAHAPARSFLRAARDESGQAVVDKLTNNLGRGIDRETAKYGGRR